MTYGDGQTFDGMGQIVSGQLTETFAKFKKRIAELEAERDLLKSALITICKDTDCLFARQTAQSALNATTASAKAKKIFS